MKVFEQNKLVHVANHTRLLFIRWNIKWFDGAIYVTNDTNYKIQQLKLLTKICYSEMTCEAFAMSSEILKKRMMGKKS